VAGTTLDPGDGEHWSLPEPVGGPYLGVQGATPPPYPECIAQSYTGTNRGDGLGLQGHYLAPPVPAEPEGPESEIPKIPRGRGDPAGTQLELFCPAWAVVGECGHGHHYAKELICGREWCRSTACGGDGGKAHQRRKARWLPKAMQMSRMAYLVVTVPEELEDHFRDMEVVRAFGISLKRVLKGHGFSRGLRRVHWFGEDHRGHGGQGDGPPRYRPHWNFLLESGRVSKAKLKAIKRSVASVLGVDIGRANIHYRYVRSVPEMLHLVKYVLRPTFEHWEWDREMAEKILGFRNTLTWGTWKDEPAWAIPSAGSDVLAVGPLEQGRCPVDGTPITWGEVIAAKLLQGPWWAELGGGYRSWTGLARDGPG